MKTKENYTAPELTVVTFKVEQGFTTSGSGVQNSIMDLFYIQTEQDYNSQAQENWHEEGNFFGDW